MPKNKTLSHKEAAKIRQMGREKGASNKANLAVRAGVSFKEFSEQFGSQDAAPKKRTPKSGDK